MYISHDEVHGGSYSSACFCLWRSWSSHGVFSRPLSGSGLILWLVGLVDLGDLWNERVIWVGVGQQGADGQEHLGDGECW